MRMPCALTSTFLLLPALLTSTSVAATPDAGAARRPVATYSIVARDPGTGEMGVAVQSHWFSVGPIVPWAEAGVGAVATQSLVEVSYGPLGLELMRAGRSAPASLAALLAGDEHPGVRQVAMIDAEGRVAVHTGEGCIQAAGHHRGETYSVQANLMGRESVWPAMARAFEAAEGPLAERMLAALEAAEEEGGDVRGRQSAALLVVSGKRRGAPWQGRLVDLRIEDHPDPVKELKRLLRLHRAYEHANAGDEAVTRGDAESALREYAAARELAPESHELVFWNAAALVSLGRMDEARPLFREAFSAWPAWAEVVPRLVPAGLLPEDEAVISEILRAGGQGGR
jgi:uncharacterized Ntn-hydrolase superfamily protein